MKMPRWKMLDVVWLDRYWRPRALIVGIVRAKDDPDEIISYDCVNEWEVTNYFRASECLSEAEWRDSIEGYLRDEYTPKEWRKRMDAIEEFKEPPCWEEFRRRFRETGDPFLPWVINGKEVRPTWRVDETLPVSLGGGGGVLVGSSASPTEAKDNDGSSATRGTKL